MKSGDELHIKIISGLSEFEGLKQAWDALYQCASERYPTVSHSWLISWLKAFARETELYVITFWRDDVLICGAPMLYRSVRALGKKRRVLSLFSNPWVDRSTILICDNNEQQVLEKFVQHLLNDAPRWDFLKLDRLAVSTDITRRIHSLFIEHHALITRESSLQSPYLPLPESWEALLQSLSSSFRQTLRRKCRKAEKFPDMRMSIRKDAAVNEAIKNISLESWQHDNNTSMYSTPQISQFYDAVIKDAAESGTLYVGLMEIDGIPIAFEFNIICGTTLHNFKLGYRKEYANHSPGIILKTFVLESFINEHVKSGNHQAEYDFMGTIEPYKLQWSNMLREHVTLTVYAKKAELILYYYWLIALKPRFRRGIKWLRSLKTKFNTK